MIISNQEQIQILVHFSLQATKNITTGEGGLITTNNKKKIYEKMRLYRSHGVEKERYLHILPGSNFRLTNLQASIGLSQLKRIELMKKREKEIFFYTKNYLKRIAMLNYKNFIKILTQCFGHSNINLEYKKIK